MCRDGILPAGFSKTDRHRTPQRVTWVAGIASVLPAGVFPIRVVADLTNIDIPATFVVAALAIYFAQRLKHSRMNATAPATVITRVAAVAARSVASGPPPTRP